MGFSREQMLALSELHGVLADIEGIDTPEQFSHVFRTLHRICGIPIEKISDYVKEYDSTVALWIDGRSLPHQQHWPWIIEEIEDLVLDSLGSDTASLVEDSRRT